MSLFVVEFGLQADHLPGFVRALMSLTALLLPLPLMVVQAVSMPLAVQLNVLVLRLKIIMIKKITFNFNSVNASSESGG